MGLGWEQLGAVVVVLGSQPKSYGFKSDQSLAVVTLSKSLCPHCSSVPSWDLASAGVAKRAVTSSPIGSVDLVWPRLDFGC